MNDSIFRPHFTVDGEMQASIEGIERSGWLVENMLLMPKHEAWVRREVSVQRATGTTRIEGASMEEEELSGLMKKSPVGKLTDDEQANINAIQAYEFVDYLSDQPDIALDELVIRELDRYFVRGASPVLTPGVYRRGENRVGEYIPPSQGDVPDLMRAFAAWLQQDSDDIHPVVRAGIAHIHLVAIHPFWDGNGRTARALTTLVLQRSPFGCKKLLSLEKLMSTVKEDYFTAIERTLGTHFDPDYDATPWLRFFIRHLMAHTITLTQRLTEWHRQMSAVYEVLEGMDLNHRQADGLAYAARTGKITRADYMEITHASPVTASRDLARLARKGLLNAMGKTRARVYLFVSPTVESTAGPPEEQGRLFDEGQTRRR
jgi:cell filamentation protein, protein adenylyltransferase